MANRYLVSGGTGNWNSTTNWSDTDGGASGASFPTSADAVFFTSLSLNAPITTNVAASALSLTVSGTYAGTITMTNILTISGAATFLSTMIISGSAVFRLQSTATHTSNGKVIPNLQFYATGATITHTLADDFTVTNLSFASAAQFVILNGFTVNINGNLTATGGSVTGTTNLIMDGTGTWSGSNGIGLNLTFNTAGTITISGNVAHSAKTITYTAGTMVVAGSQCSFGGTQTINTSGMTWNDINNLSTNGTITLTSNISAVNVSAGSTSSDGTINGFTVFVSGNLTFNQTTGRTLGTTVFTMTGTGTLSSLNTSGKTQNDITFDTAGSIIISGAINYSNGTITYTQGTIDATGSTLNIKGSATLNTNGMSWYDFTVSATSTITNNSLLTVTNTMTYSAAVTWAGTSAWTAQNITDTTAGLTHTLVAALTYTINGLMTMQGTPSNKKTIKSSIASSYALLNLKSGQNNLFLNGTDIDSSGGLRIYSRGGTITRCLNWAQKPQNIRIIKFPII